MVLLLLFAHVERFSDSLMHFLLLYICPHLWVNPWILFLVSSRSSRSALCWARTWDSAVCSVVTCRIRLRDRSYCMVRYRSYCR